MGREIGSFHVRPADLNQLRGLPAVAAEERDGDAQLPRLFHHQPHVRVVPRDEDGVGVGGLHRGQLALEIPVAAIVALLRNHPAAAGDEWRLEIAGQPDAVIGFGVGKDRHIQRFERPFGKVGQQESLEFVGETNPENVIADFGQLHVGRGRGNHRDLVGLADVGRFHGARGSHFSQHCAHAIAGDEFLDHRRRLALLGLVIFADQLDFAAEHSAGGIDLLNGQLRAVVRHLPKSGLAAGERSEFADVNRVAGRSLATRKQQGQGQQGQDFPEESPTEFLHNFGLRRASLSS